MIKKILFIFIAALMLLMTIISAVRAEVMAYDLNPVYYYYGDTENQNIPIVLGPFPRYYLANKDFQTTFHPDDLNHFDEFIGYKDLDVFYPDENRVDVIRNPNAEELDLSSLPEGVQRFGYHVYGELPGNSYYRKHYMHEHPWDAETYDYDYSYGNAYGYYTPFLAYRTQPSYTRPCQSRSLCQYTRNCC
jgi:hypothetical protein